MEKIEWLEAKGLEQLTLEEIREILNLAMDSDDWHTPSACDIKIHTHTDKCVYGYCNVSMHNQYHDLEHWFNINHDTVAIWKEEYVRNKCNISHFRRIHNIIKLGQVLQQLKPPTP